MRVSGTGTDLARDGQCTRDRVAYRCGQAAFIGEVDVDEAADRLRDHILFLRNGAGETRPVNFDDERAMLNVEGKTTSITDLSIPASKDSCPHVLDSKLIVYGMPVNDDGHNPTIPLQYGRMCSTWPYWMRKRSLEFEIYVRRSKASRCCQDIRARNVEFPVGWLS